MTAHWHEEFFWTDKSVLKLDRGNGCTLYIYIYIYRLNTMVHLQGVNFMIKNYWAVHFNGWILSSVNYTLIKLFEKVVAVSNSRSVFPFLFSSNYLLLILKLLKCNLNGDGMYPDFWINFNGCICKNEFEYVCISPTMLIPRRETIKAF